RQDWVADNDELLNFHNLLALRTMTGNLEAGVKETRAALRDLKGQTNLPIAIYFSPKRQLPGQPRTLSAPKAFDPVQAYSRALSDREVELREFMHWFRTQETLGAGEGSPQAAVLDSLRNVVSQLVPEFTNLRIVEEPRLGFVVEKDGKSLYLHQLSDGERGLLALVFDLTRRLAIANPESEDPISEGVALVLLDEVELHLHPKWQRHVVRRLCQVFKNCQFVITTHSPQVIGQVKAEKLRVLNINDSGKVVLFQPTQAFGMDSSWVLQNIMGVPARDYETEQKLSKVFDAIDEGKYGDARELANEMRAEIGDFPDLQEAIALLDRFELLGQG
ncbi:MAG: AAA family ATPase, partial [Shewanella sp.]|nr:AAA family ATPase [Shewanella sp.]